MPPIDTPRPSPKHRVEVGDPTFCWSPSLHCDENNFLLPLGDGGQDQAIDSDEEEELGDDAEEGEEEKKWLFFMANLGSMIAKRG